jgi:cyclic pyranopterin phosphate synthase
MHDARSRPLRDLRLSVTDRCNFRCRYCMPKEVFGRGYDFLPRAEILSLEECARLVRIFATLGMEKLRITGGEPLLRRNIEALIRMVHDTPGLRDIALTTNASVLADKAAALRAAGLHRLTVSLDALDDATFRAMNDVDFPVERVLAGIDAALDAGFSPIKINMVVKRGVNEAQIGPMARRFSGPRYTLRFIEYMDVGNSNGWRMDDVVTADEILARIDTPLTPLPANYEGETALRYSNTDGGEIGIIASVSRPFCKGCTRARLTADGKLFTCLFASHGHDLRTPLRSGASDSEIASLLENIWRRRDDRYSELRSLATPSTPKAEMSLLGG